MPSKQFHQSPRLAGACYVYIQLPESIEMITCGRYERLELRTGGLLGRFFYGQSYLARPDAVPLDPLHLPLRRGAFETAMHEGMFGALRDAAPDSWGQRVIERELQRTDLTPLDYLLHSPEDRAGALSFGLGQQPPAPTRQFNRVVQLTELRQLARLLEEDAQAAPLPEQVHDLLMPGTSLGGARPKNVVEDAEGLWVAKFPSRADRWNNAPVEAAMLALARRCGIQVPPTRIERVGDADVLLVKRFDRQLLQREDATPVQNIGYLRHRMVSALTVLDADESAVVRRNWSYVLLADEIQRWSARPAADKRELFRRMVLNALVSNLDDHPRNHALIAPGRDWQLAPAYDITPSPVYALERRELALVCGVHGRVACRENLLSEVSRFALSRDDANAMIDEFRAIVSTHWASEVRRHGGTVEDCGQIQRAMLYDGFEYPVTVFEK